MVIPTRALASRRGGEPAFSFQGGAHRPVRQRLTPVRHVPPVHSPLDFRAVLAAFATSDPRPALATDLRREYQATEVTLTASGTDALTLALMIAARARPGLPCALPAYGCYDLATAAIGAGVRVRLYDLDPITLQPAPASLERALSGGVSALVVAHLFGVPVPMDAMRHAAGSVGALLIEDAAQGNGGTWQGRPLGAHGDLGILSFGRGKGETGGTGGALMVHSAGALQHDLRTLMSPSHGGATIAGLKLAAQWLLGRPALYAIPSALPMLRLGETIYKTPTAPRAMSAGAARVLRHTRRASAGEARARRANAERLLRSLGEHASVACGASARATAGWLRFPILVDATPGQLAAGRALGIIRGYPIALRDLEPLRPLLDDLTATPGATRMARVLHTLPTHGLLGEGDLRALEQWLSSVVRGA